VGIEVGIMLRRKLFVRLLTAAMALAGLWFPFAAGAPCAHATDATDAAKYNCDRECLKGITDLYFRALEQHNPSLLPLAPNAKYTETGLVVKLGEGLWRTAGAPGYRLEIYDPETGGIGLDAVVPDRGVPTIVATRLKVENQQVTEIETILVHKGDKAVFSAPEKLVEASAHFTRKIAAPEQNSRLELMAAADAYFRAFQTEGTPEYIRAPLLSETLRVENGMQATNVATPNHPAISAGEQFDRAIFQGTKIYDRRYPVVDTQVGAVMALVRFHHDAAAPPPGAAPNRGDTVVCEIFAVEQGKIVEIQATWIPPAEQLTTPW
jgi:hypothetical protein